MAAAITRLPSRALRGARRRAGALRRRFSQPLVTVVVPVYHVESYVAECLTSVLSQTYARLQVIVVDDGGTDSSMDIVRRVTAGDRRVTIISQPNAGLGAARNTGVRATRGAFLRFFDSDDVLPLDSIAVLLRSLERSGSDFVVGNLRRLTSAGSWVPGWAREVHAVDRYGIGLDDLPDVLKDPFAHNKLFRTSFFREVVQGFPEGVLYEDQEPSARAYVGGRFDVLRTVVYEWREREDGTSITQQKSDPVDLRDRLQVKERVSRIIGEGASPAVAEHWRAKAVGFDLRPYFEQVPRTDLVFWEQLQTGTRRVAEQLDVRTWQQVPMLDRLLSLAVVGDHRSDVVDLLTKREEYGWRLPGIAVDGVVTLDPAYLEGLQLDPPAELLRMAEPDLAVRSLVEAIRWSGSTLSVDAYAHVRNLDLSRVRPPGGTTEVELVSELTGEVRPMGVEPRFAPTVDIESSDAWNTFDGAAFTATVDLAGWPTAPTGETWRIRVRVAAGGVVRETVLGSLDRRRAVAQLPVGPWQPETGRWVLEHDRHLGLGVKLDPVGAGVPVLDVSAQGRTVELVLDAPGPAALVAESSRTRHRVRALPREAGAGRVAFSLDLPPVPADQRDESLEWRVRAETPTGPLRAVWAGTSEELAARTPAAAEVRPRCTREGTLRLRQDPWGAAVDDVVLHGIDSDRRVETIAAHGHVSPVPGATWSAHLVNSEHRRTDPVLFAVGPAVGEVAAFAVEVALVDDAGLLIEGDAYELELTCQEPSGDALTRRVAMSEALLPRLPLEQLTPRRGLTCTRSDEGMLRLRPRRPNPEDERGRLAQRRIHDTFFGPLDGEPQPWVVFESFSGRSVGDSVLALYHELARRHPDWGFFFSVEELTAPVPAGATPLLRTTREWARVVQQATYLVNNANFPHFFRKRPHQTYVQTWHGTPLKKIGDDIPTTNLTLSYRAAMRREPLMWDYLLAQNPFAAAVLPKAFGFVGTVVDTGYPRNDVLADGETIRKGVRHELGLADDAYVVLYAPTWRDDVRTKFGRYELVSFLDFDRAVEQLPDVTFLLRGHSNTVSAGYSSAAVRDVTSHPDINALMLAADALVTDYSSVMFDFCVTGKPMYFLVPDLEHYGSTTRGFYFDLPEVAPGPVCLTDAELFTALAERDQLPGTYRERYAAFVARFAPADDGHASERVVDLIWGSHEQHLAP